jgi:hypothetical protein
LSVTAVSDLDDHVRVRGDFDSPSRWLWLVKWCVLAVPHYPILILLYMVYPLLTIVAGVAILFTGRYPRPIFDFNVGVLRWSWRVMNYRFPMNSTDRYPPFTLAAWLLALPQVLLCWAMEPLLQVLTVIAAVALLCTGTIPRGMFELLMGIVRWRYRVAVYVSLMRDEYPPFQLDLGSR